MKKIAVFTGTRAEYGLLYWLLKGIQESSELDLQLIVSGTHLSPEHGYTYDAILEDGFAVDSKTEILLSSDSPVAVAKSMGLLTLSMADELSRLSPDVVVLLGDRYEALAVAQTALIQRIPIVHLHGGEVTEGAYDDSIRHAITKLSTYHCTSTEAYRSRVIQMGELPDHVKNVGALGLEHLNRSTLMTRQELSDSLDFDLSLPFLLVTFHPETLSDLGAREQVLPLLNALDHFDKYKVILTYPNADDGGREIIDEIETYRSKSPSRVFTIPSLGFVRYLSAVKYASAVVGNSSSGIIEVPSFKVPTVNVGDRQKGRLAAESVLHANNHEEDILNALNTALSAEFRDQLSQYSNPYGEGNTSEKILELLRTMDPKFQKRFHDISTGESF